MIARARQVGNGRVARSSGRVSPARTPMRRAYVASTHAGGGYADGRISASTPDGGV